MVTFHAHTVTYYVAPGGNEDNPGTAAQPWPDFHTASRNVEPGDSILIRGGEYYINNENNRFRATGRRDAWIVIAGYPGEKPIFNAEDATGAAMDIGGAYLHIQNLHVWKSGGKGIRFAPKTHHIELRDCSIDSARSSAIHVWQASNVRIIGNRIRWGVYQLNNGNGLEALHVNGAVNFEIAWNEVLDGGNIGIDVLGLYHGRVHHNYVRNHYRSGIYIDAWSKMRDIEVYANRVEDDEIVVASEGGSGLRDLRIHHNIVSGGGFSFPLHGNDGLREDVYIFNNTCFEGRFNVRTRQVNRINVFNNLFAREAGIIDGCESCNIVLDHNYIADESLFVDPSAGDFSPVPDAPFIDSGRIGSEYRDPDGTRGDIGARYRYQGPNGIPHPPEHLRAMWWWNKAKVSLSWSAPSDGSNSFAIERSTPGGAWVEIARIDHQAATVFEDPTVAAETEYRYRIFTISSDGTSLPSNEASIFTMSPTQPPTLRAEAIGASKVRLSWTPTGGVCEGSIIYRMRPWGQTLGEVGPEVREHVVDNLASDTTHSFSIISYNQADFTSSDTVTVRTQPLENPRALWIEAESARDQALFSPYIVGEDTLASEGEYIVIPPESRSWEYLTKQPSEGICRYTVTMEKEFTVWMRTQRKNAGSNSLWLKVNDNEWEMMDLSGRGWQWQRAGNYQPLDGENQVVIAQREAELKVDKILVTNMLGYKPPESKFDDTSATLAEVRNRTRPAPLRITVPDRLVRVEVQGNVRSSATVYRPDGSTFARKSGRGSLTMTLPQASGVYLVMVRTEKEPFIVKRIMLP